MRLIIDLVYRGKKWRAVPKSSSRDIQDMPKKKKVIHRVLFNTDDT